MSDYIKREDAIEELEKWHKFYKDATIPTDKARRDELSAMISKLMNLPSADVVEVVRCIDCKHYKGLAECELELVESMGTYWYCACGERKDNE